MAQQPEAEDRECYICLEVKAPGPLLPESVLDHTGIQEWMNVCSACGKMCIVRTYRSQIAMMDRVLNLQMSWVRDYGVNFPPRHQ